MLKTIRLNDDKEIKLKSSAATNILYKKLFREDILLTITSYTKNLQELQNMQAKFTQLKEDSTKSREELVAIINEMTNSEAFTTAQKFQSETLPKLAFIMYLEANETMETIFSKLTEEQYLFWLMTIDQDELLAVVGEVMEIWQAGSRTNSKPKN